MGERIAHKADYVLLSTFILILLFGLLMLSSASAPVGLDRFQDAYFFIKRQLLFGVIPGIIAFFIFAKVPYQKWYKLSTVVYASIVILLILVFIPGIGSNLNTTAHSWLVIGGYSVQPAEFAKLGLIIYLAALMAKKGKGVEDFQYGFLSTLIAGMIPIVLVMLQPDIGTLAILFAILFGMLFLSETKLKDLGILALGGILAFALLILIAPYRIQRLTTFLHPELDPRGIGYQMSQAQVAIGSGGLFGLGIAHSRQKFQYLPEVHADSIFAVVAEETGFVISSLLIVAFVVVGYRGFLIAKHADDDFGRYLAGGITIWFLSQAFLNIGSIVGVMPLTGVPLPFVSHGGTALMIALAAVGILINVSKYASIPKR